MKNFNVWKLGEKEKWRNKGMNESSSLIPVYKIHLPTVYVCTKFQSSRPNSSWEKCDEKFQCWKLERKKNEEIKEWISSMIHLPTVHVCTNFQTSRPHSSREKCDKNIQCWKLERKKNEEINGRISSSSLTQYTWYICPLPTRVPSFNLLGLTVPEKSVDEKF